jgi:hypothetical protein
MFNFSQPIQLYRSQIESRIPSRFWVCEWQSATNGSVQNGTFLVEAGHFLDAKQTAKKVLRDDLIHSLKFTFTIRLPSLLERAQLKITPPIAILENKNPAPACAPGGEKFAEPNSADSKSKT